MRSTYRRVARLEAQQGVNAAPVGRHVLVEVHTLSAADAEQRIAEAEAVKQSGDLLIIVDRVRDLSYLEGYDDETGLHQTA